MELKELIEHLYSLKVKMWIREDKLKYQPAGLVSEDIKAQMIIHKKAIMKILYNDFIQDVKIRTENAKNNLPDKNFSPLNAATEQTSGGVGTEIKKILSRFGIVATANCSCNKNAKLADQWGPDECEKRADEIIGWMQVEATKRRLPFFIPIARMILRRAIRAARKT